LIAAVEEIGIQASDFDAFYAYLIPYFPQLYPYSPMMAQAGPPLADLSLEQMQPFENAFLKLLEPATLDQFSQLWAKDKDQALESVGLPGGQKDAQLLYGYLAQFNIS
jgi:hypothetical protein